MNRSMLRTSIFTSCLLFAAGSVFAQAPTGGQADAAFVKAASASGVAEVNLGNLAIQKGGSEGVKDFGKTMVEDHTKAADQLKTIASSKSMPVSSDPMPADAKALEQMGQKNGAAFDTAFKQKMIADHQKAVALFSKESESGKDPELKAFATTTLPTLKHHLEMAQNLPAAK